MPNQECRTNPKSMFKAALMAAVLSGGRTLPFAQAAAQEPEEKSSPQSAVKIPRECKKQLDSVVKLL